MVKKLALIVGGTILVLSSFAISMNIRGRPLRPSELSTPVIESPLYLTKNYEEESANLSAMEDEYAETLSLWKERRQGKEWQLPLFLITGLLGGGVFFSGVEDKRYFFYKHSKTKKIITKVPYTKNVKRD